MMKTARVEIENKEKKGRRTRIDTIARSKESPSSVSDATHVQVLRTPYPAITCIYRGSPAYGGMKDLTEYIDYARPARTGFTRKRDVVWCECPTALQQCLVMLQVRMQQQECKMVQEKSAAEETQGLRRQSCRLQVAGR